MTAITGFVQRSGADPRAYGGLDLVGFAGMHYNPFTRDCRIGGSVDVNYLAHCLRPEH